MALITSMSSKGQVVLPKKIRTAMKLSAGTQFAVFSHDDNILLKPIKDPNLSEFVGLLDQARDWAASEGMCKNDITEAIKAVRKKS